MTSTRALLVALSALLTSACGPGDETAVEPGQCSHPVDGDVVLDFPAVPEQLEALEGIECIRGNLELRGTVDSLEICGDDLCATELTVSGETYAALASLRVIEGELAVEATLLGDLEFLAALERVDGDYTIADNPLLTAIHGPDELTELGGTLEIHRNLSLDYIEGFAGLEQLESLVIHENGDYSWNGQRGLTAILGPHNLTRITGDLRITHEDAVETLEGLRKLVEVGGELEIGGCVGDFGSLHKLSSFSGLRSLERIGGDFVLPCFNGAADMSRLDSLVEIDGSLRVAGNPLFGTYGPYYLRPPALREIGGGLSITRQNNLDDVDGFDAITTLAFLELDTLETFHSLDGLFELERIEGDLSIRYLPIDEATVADYVAKLEVGGTIELCGNSEDWTEACP